MATQPWEEFLDLIDEAFTQHRQWRETQDASLSKLDSGVQSRITQSIQQWIGRAGYEAVSYYDRYGIKPNSGGT